MNKKFDLSEYKFGHQFIIMGVSTSVFRYEYDDNYVFIFTIYQFPDSYDVFVGLDGYSYQRFVYFIHRFGYCENCDKEHELSFLDVELIIDKDLDVIIYDTFVDFGIIKSENFVYEKDKEEP